MLTIVLVLVIFIGFSVTIYFLIRFKKHHKIRIMLRRPKSQQFSKGFIKYDTEDIYSRGRSVDIPERFMHFPPADSDSGRQSAIGISLPTDISASGIALNMGDRLKSQISSGADFE